MSCQRGGEGEKNQSKSFLGNGQAKHYTFYQPFMSHTRSPHNVSVHKVISAVIAMAGGEHRECRVTNGLALPLMVLGMMSPPSVPQVQEHEESGVTDVAEVVVVVAARREGKSKTITKVRPGPCGGFLPPVFVSHSRHVSTASRDPQHQLDQRRRRRQQQLP